jgi:hypothetical protein
MYQGNGSPVPSVARAPSDPRATLVQEAWHQYKKTWVGTQLLIGVVTAGVLLRSHRLIAALAFFLTMQLGGLIGAMWAIRLKNRVERTRAEHRA